MRASQAIRSWLPVTLPSFASALLAILKARDRVRCVRCRRVTFERKTCRQYADHRCKFVLLWYFRLAPNQHQRCCDRETFHRISKLQSTFVLPAIPQPIIDMPSNSAYTAGVSSPSTSTVTACFTKNRFASLRSTDMISVCARTRLPARTGFKKRTLSSP